MREVTKDLRSNPKFRLLLIGAMLVLIAHLVAVTMSPKTNSGIELGIAREAGQLWLNGVNNYRTDEGKEVRERLRTDEEAFNAYVSGEQGRWDYYTAAAPPGSVLFYAAAESISGGDWITWRYLLLGGGVLIAAGGLAWLFAAANPSKRDLALGLVFLAFFPGMFRSGILIPQDEPIEAGLILCYLAAAYSGLDRPNRATWAGVLMGLSIAFKGMGVFFLPTLWARFTDLRTRIVAITLTIAVVLAVFMAFDLNVVSYALVQWRSATAGGGGSTIFLILPLATKAMLAAAFAALVLLTFVWRKIDVANACAATLVIYVCILSANVGMDTLSIAMIVGTMAIASLSMRLWRVFAIVNFLIPAFIYAAHHHGPDAWFQASIERAEAWVTIAFLVSYAAFLGVCWLRSQQSAAPPASLASTSTEGAA